MAEHWEVVHGGKTVISLGPEEMWEKACAYFKWCSENPIVRVNTIPVGKYAGGTYTQNSVRPYTIDALCLHLGITKDYLKSIGRTKDDQSLYYLVVERILTIVRNQNIEYAMVGDFNSIFVTKLLNLDKDETPTDRIRIEVVSSSHPVHESEADILKKIESGEDGPMLNYGEDAAEQPVDSDD
jgi:hypothetical protein